MIMAREQILPSPGAPTAGDYGRMLLRGWSLILAATLLSIGAAWLADSLVASSYSATSRVFLTAPGPSSPRAAMDGNRSSLVRVESYVQLVTSEQVLRRVILDVGLDADVAELKGDLLAAATPGSALIDIAATSEDAEAARDTANSAARQLIQLSAELQMAGSAPASEVTLIDAATTPSATTTWRANVILGGGMGCVVSAVLVIAAGVRRDVIVSRGQVENIVSDRSNAIIAKSAGGVVR